MSTYRVLKRTLDVVVSVAVLAMLSPILFGIAAAIRAPVFYRGVRAGRGGRPFTMLKFRTMVVDAEALGPSSTASLYDKALDGIDQVVRPPAPTTTGPRVDVYQNYVIEAERREALQQHLTAASTGIPPC